MTGHSLGGALALLGGSMMAYKGFPVSEIYTFGQPRVGNDLFRVSDTAPLFTLFMLLCLLFFLEILPEIKYCTISGRAS